MATSSRAKIILPAPTPANGWCRIKALIKQRDYYCAGVPRTRPPSPAWCGMCSSSSSSSTSSVSFPAVEREINSCACTENREEESVCLFVWESVCLCVCLFVCSESREKQSGSDRGALMTLSSVNLAALCLTLSQRLSGGGKITPRVSNEIKLAWKRKSGQLVLFPSSDIRFGGHKHN